MAPRRRRQNSKAIKAVSTGVAVIQANIMTELLFNQSLPQFIMGGNQDGSLRSGFQPSSGVTKISLKEIFQFDKYKGSSSNSLAKQVSDNFKANFWQQMPMFVGLSVGNAMLKKFGMYRQMNKLTKSVGLNKMVTFS